MPEFFTFFGNSRRRKSFTSACVVNKHCCCSLVAAHLQIVLYGFCSAYCSQINNKKCIFLRRGRARRIPSLTMLSCEPYHLPWLGQKHYHHEECWTWGSESFCISLPRRMLLPHREPQEELVQTDEWLQLFHKLLTFGLIESLLPFRNCRYFYTWSLHFQVAQK